MEDFLHKLADKITADHPGDLSRVCVVFPNRRAGLHFKRHLAAAAEKPVFPPSVFAIQDLVHHIMPAIIPENLSLVFELYRVYRNYEPDLSFDRFYLWGEMVLGDFDMIDKNLADTEILFKNIKALKAIDEELKFNIADIESFRLFWESFSNTELTTAKGSFLRVWEILNKVYTEFKDVLKEKNYAYEGMLYRELAKSKDLLTRFTQWDKVIFAGFNILSGAEQKIIQRLSEKGIAETYWDADKYYLDDTKQEAGKFLRKNLKTFKQKKVSWVEDSLISSAINIDTYAVPLKTGQVKALSNELLKLCSKPSFVPEKTAIVLPDESLLIPLLYSLPEGIKDINITMGFALKSTPFYSLLELIKDLNNTCINEGSEPSYHNKNIIQILLHPYIKFIGGSSVYETARKMLEGGRINLYPSHFITEDTHPVIQTIFRSVKEPSEVFEYIISIIEGIQNEIKSNTEESNPSFESEHFFHFRRTINKLKDIFENYGEKLSLKTFWTLLTGVLKHVKIPFTGEPLKGLQIMGLLETRTLDFENIFILSMNEGVFPKGDFGNSFIPYNLRRAFGLPVYEDEDSGYAYNFYRLLQRAKNVHLFYNSEAGEVFANEASRYISQVKFELVRLNENINFKEHVVTVGTGITPARPIIIEKTPEVMEQLNKIKYLSATSLSKYINCPLQFYMRYIAKLKPQEPLDEIIDPRRFGSIFHNVMSALYMPYCNKELTRPVIDQIYPKIDEAIDNAFRTEIKDPDFTPGGKNLLVKKILGELVIKVLDNDKKDTPFTIKSLEQLLTCTVTISGKDQKLTLGGKIDRMDVKDNITRIIDYKTGNVKIFKPRGSLPEYFGDMIRIAAYSQSFQAYFYAHLFNDVNKGQPVKIGLYSIKQVNKPIDFFNDQEMSPFELAEFETVLKDLVKEVYDPSIPFMQTSELRNCQFCDFATICNRPTN